MVCTCFCNGMVVRDVFHVVLLIVFLCKYRPCCCARICALTSLSFTLTHSLTLFCNALEYCACHQGHTRTCASCFSATRARTFDRLHACDVCALYRFIRLLSVFGSLVFVHMWAHAVWCVLVDTAPAADCANGIWNLRC